MSALTAELAALGAILLGALSLGVAWLRGRARRAQVRRAALAHRQARARLDGAVSGAGERARAEVATERAQGTDEQRRAEMARRLGEMRGRE